MADIVEYVIRDQKKELTNNITQKTNKKMNSKSNPKLRKRGTIMTDSKVLFGRSEEKIKKIMFHESFWKFFTEEREDNPIFIYFDLILDFYVNDFFS